MTEPGAPGTAKTESWRSGSAYERYVGRWSRRVAVDFVRWLNPSAGLAWGDVGCGTGALSATILSLGHPASVHGVDASEGFIAEARQHVGDSRARFEIGDATQLPWDAASHDVTVSGLVLNFVRDPGTMAREMVRVTRPGGIVAAYVWDYAGGMQMMRHFWDAAIAVSPNDAKLSQAERFPICQPEPLQHLFAAAGLHAVRVRAIDIETTFMNFEDFWTPFLGRTGAAPTYLAAVSDELRKRIRQTLASRLTPLTDGRIDLSARAWAVRGTV